MSPWDEQSSLRGSPLYMAPEIVCRRQYDARVDLWSVGVILYGERALGVFFFFIYFFYLDRKTTANFPVIRLELQEVSTESHTD